MKVLCFFETNNFIFGFVVIRCRLLPQNWIGRCSQTLDRTALESLGPTVRIRLKLGFWTSIQVRFLHGKSSRPLYTRGVTADRNNTNLTNTSTTLSFSSLSHVSFFSFFVVLRVGGQRIHEALGAVRPT